jgi:hypothetical protein
MTPVEKRAVMDTSTSLPGNLCRLLHALLFEPVHPGHDLATLEATPERLRQPRRLAGRGYLQITRELVEIRMLTATEQAKRQSYCRDSCPTTEEVN